MTYLWRILLLVLLLTGMSHAQNASWGTDNPQGSLRLLLEGKVTLRMPAGLPGVLALPVQSQHPPPPPEGEVYYYLMPNGAYVLTSKGTPQLVGPSVTDPSIQAHLVLSSAQDLPSKKDTLILWNRAEWDTSGFLDATQLGHIQIKQGGTYAMLCGLQYEPASQGTMKIYARKGSGSEIGVDSKTAAAEGDTRVNLPTSAIFAAGETLEVYGSQTSGKPLKVLSGSGTFCSVKKTG